VVFKIKILVVSDTHKSFSPLLDLVLEYKGKIDLVIHLGDGEDDVEDLSAAQPYLPIRAVSGNCDWASLKPGSDIVNIDGAKIFICHGHTLGVERGPDRLALEARRLGASTALFGHTHRQYHKDIFGIQCINPGSLCKPRDGKYGYAILETVNGVVNCVLHQIDR